MNECNYTHVSSEWADTVSDCPVISEHVYVYADVPPPRAFSAPDPMPSTPRGKSPLTCEADGALEGAAHALEAVLDQVA